MKVFLKRNCIIGPGKDGFANTKVEVDKDVGNQLIAAGKAEEYEAKTHDKLVKAASKLAEKTK